MPLQTRVECPVCNISRMESSYKRKDEQGFGNWDEDSPIIQIRDAPGGKATEALVGTGKYRKSPGRGFPIVDVFTVDVAKDMPEYSEYVKMIAEQLVKVAGIFYRQGLISDEDVDSIRK